MIMNRLKVFFLIIFCYLLSSQNGQAQKIERVEPIFWWVDMKTDLQLMIYGKDLKDCQVKVREEGMKVKKVHAAENPNYLFVDVDVTKPGKYNIDFSKGKKVTTVTYQIFPRRENSANRIGFNSADAIYLIMPDRFANGDVSNDIVKGNAQILNRNDLTVRHGGDIKGVMNHLDYLADLGITAIWLTPVFEDNLYYHQYGVTDFYRIDPHFGTNELYSEFVEQAHKKGVKIIQDITPNHCGIDHWWFNDPPFNDWINPKEMEGNFWVQFAVEALSDVHASENDQLFVGNNWLFDTMPDMNLRNPFVLKYMYQMAIWWIEYANLDGLRVDTYFYMGKKSGDWTKAILDEYPNFSLVGEIWDTEPAFLSYWVGSTDNKDGFSSHLPMVMDFPLQAAIVTELTGKGAHWGGVMRGVYSTIAKDFLYKNPEKSQVIFADNHDISRIYNMLGKDLKKVKLAMTLIMTTRGLPQIFYGTELLFENDSVENGHSNRPDFPGGWQEDAINLFQEKYRTPEQQEMFNHTRTLLHFRKQTPLIHTGKLMHYIPINGVYTYFRYDEKECLMVILNASDSEKSVDWNRFDERLNNKTEGVNILDKTIITKDDDVKISPKTSMVIHFK